ncbi:fumarylacetoacetate hydrolase family protein [Kribbella sp. NPDC003505]|uniref:fumarylacetoacetate hydrolase family protein n=1 Tax=Kribbella sp. NPDC003505 TaxID=3154448 RepID=UPI0033AF7786
MKTVSFGPRQVQRLGVLVKGHGIAPLDRLLRSFGLRGRETDTILAVLQWLHSVIEDASTNGEVCWFAQMTRAKGIQTGAPLGPWLVSQDEIPDQHDLELRCWVNGELRQQESRRQMIVHVPHLIEDFSKVIELPPGGVIMTGTTTGVAAPSSIRRGSCKPTTSCGWRLPAQDGWTRRLPTRAPSRILGPSDAATCPVQLYVGRRLPTHTDCSIRNDCLRSEHGKCVDPRRVF